MREQQFRNRSQNDVKKTCYNNQLAALFLHFIFYLVFVQNVRFLRYSCFDNSHPSADGLLDFQNFESLELEHSESNTDFIDRLYLGIG